VRQSAAKMMKRIRCIVESLTEDQVEERWFEIPSDSN
jgi:hypothetical protein